MKIVIIGGNGTIGNKVVSYFEKENNVLVAGRTSGNVTVDITEVTQLKGCLKRLEN